MLQSALVIVVAGGAVANTYPDQLDIFRGADTTPQIELLLDTSYSMEGGSPDLNTDCFYYYNRWISSTPDADNPMKRLDLLKAVLTGCRGESDGILDIWADRVVFAVREFGTEPTPSSMGSPRTDLRANFFGGPTDSDGIPVGSNLPNLEAAVISLFGRGATPMTLAYEQAGRHFAGDFDNNNSRSCRQNYIIILSDGNGNYSHGDNASTFNWLTGQTNLGVSDTWGCYNVGGCNQAPPLEITQRPYFPPFLDQGANYVIRDSATGSYVDALPRLDNLELPNGSEVGQPIRTYGINFMGPADGLELMSQATSNGEGRVISANNYDQLRDAFSSIIDEVVPRAQVSFNAGAIQNDGLFSGNYMYVPTFRPVATGPWFGTLKKHCIMPASPSDQTCFFMDNGSGEMITNPNVVDQWTNTSQRNATIGGTGQQIFTELYNVAGPSSPVPSAPYSRRNIMTWRPGSNAYVAVDNSPSFTPADTRTANACEHFKLINKLYGFTDEVTDCDAGNYNPVGFDTWAQADTANGGTILLKFSQECETASSQCYVITNSNEGMLHVFRARDGTELSAVIPAELWGTSQVAYNQLRDMMQQPYLDAKRRYYFDGGMRLFHQDSNGNGYVDNSETAYLIAGLGRGGRGYYLWDVSSFNGDFSSSSAPDPKPLLIDEATGFRNLRETWAAPWVGLLRDNTGNFRKVAAFPSGHMRELDGVDKAFAVLEAGIAPVPGDTQSSPHSLSCTAFGLDPILCTPPFPATGCTACATVSGCPPVSPPTTAYCYDWPGYAGDPAAAPFDNGQPAGHDLLFGPFGWAQGNQTAESYRVVFTRFQLQPGDYMEFLDETQTPVGRLTGSGAGGSSGCSGSVCSPWINSERFYVRVVSDGNDASSVLGWSASSVQVVRRNLPPSGRNSGDFHPSGPNLTRPSIFVVDLDDWSNLASFGAAPVGADTRQRSALMVRITSDCDGLGGAGEICLDAAGTGGQPPQPDLAYMTCPISSEIVSYEEGGVFRAGYVGDECGQIWKFAQNNAGEWSAIRLLRLNNAGANGAVVDNLRSEDYRKIFTRLELVLSRCNGSRSIGVYFGTGNMQLPGSATTAKEPSIVGVPNWTSPELGDVIGVVWDSPNTARPADGLGLEDLEDISDILEVSDPLVGNAVNGFFIGLYQEKMLRPPVVFDGVATFKVYSAQQEASECLSAIGADFTVQFDNCTGAPVADGIDSGSAVGNSTLDRFTWQGQTDIGGGLLMFTPRTGDAFVSTADASQSTGARLPGRETQRAMRMYLWRTQVDL